MPPDPNRPIWDQSRYGIDRWAGHNFKMFPNTVDCRVQLNATNIFENGRLQAAAYNPDGTPYAFRIIAPRKFLLTVTIDL